MPEERDKANTISAPLLYLIMLLMLIFGTCNTVVMKAQDDHVIYPDETKDHKKYNHPFFQCFNMFVGELCCLGAYALRLLLCKPKRQVDNESEGEEVPLSPGAREANKVQLKTKINPLLLAIPAAFDICGSTLMFVGLTQCAASIYQMMRGAIVVITAGMAMIFLGRKQYTHHYVSLVMIVAAVAIVGVAGIVASDDGEDDKTPTTPIGVGLIILAQLFTGGQFVTEEKLLSGYYLDPLLVVGLEGFWGCVYYSILLPIFQNVHCETKPDSNGLCHYNPEDGYGPKAGTIEDTKEAWKNLTGDSFLIATSIGIIISIACFNATGVAITKYASAPQRSTVDTSRTLLIWIVQMAMGQETFIWGQLVGFVLLVAGTLIYNEIWIVPIDCMNRMTQVK